MINNFLPNTTQVPNIIFDKIMAHLTGSEFKVLLFFVRQRYGFQKFHGQFSYAIKQICEGIKNKEGCLVCEGTGLSNRQVLNSLKTLKEKYHLIKMKHGDFKGKICNKYELTIGEISSSNDKTLGEESSPTLGEESSPMSVKKVHYQETKKKPIETNNKKKSYDSLYKPFKTLILDKHPEIDFKSAYKDKKKLGPKLGGIYSRLFKDYSLFHYTMFLLGENDDCKYFENYSGMTDDFTKKYLKLAQEEIQYNSEVTPPEKWDYKLCKFVRSE